MAKNASPKISNSNTNRTTPGTGTGAPPDLLGSSGTAKVPQIAAAAIGNAIAST